jgi:hypothetical protein
MKKAAFFLAAAFCMMVSSETAKAQVPILYYDFENNTNRASFENVVEQAINSGSGAVGRIGGTVAQELQTAARQQVNPLLDQVGKLEAQTLAFLLLTITSSSLTQAASLE